jgi:hypothetical protein
LVAWRRCGGFYRSLAAACATAGMAIRFALDRPYLITFLLLAATIAILEYRRWLWLLPPLFLIWANCHGGFFLGWLVLAAYSAEALWQRAADVREPLDLQRPLGAALGRQSQRISHSAGAALLPREQRHQKSARMGASRMVRLQRIHHSVARRRALMLWAWRRVRIVDWILFAAFAAAAFSAQRNTILVGLIAPIVIVSYFPWKRVLPPAGAVRRVAAADRRGHGGILGQARFNCARRNGAIPPARPIFCWPTTSPAPSSILTNTAAI